MACSLRRNVKGKGSSREGQSADDMQVVEGKGSCKRSSVHTEAQLVQVFYDGVPDLVYRHLQKAADSSEV
jgi:hypothetical protein